MARLKNVRNGMSKESAEALARHPSNADTYRTRAYQYACAMLGIESEHSAGMMFKGRDLIWEQIWVNGRRQKRIRAIYVGPTPYEIPNWDFVPEEPVCETAQEEPTLFVAPTSTCIEHAYGSVTRLSFQINVF